jgi:hypothetical protein
VGGPVTGGVLGASVEFDSVGAGVGHSEIRVDSCGAMDGCSVGNIVGFTVGDFVSPFLVGGVGAGDGCVVGLLVDGFFVGSADGEFVAPFSVGFGVVGGFVGDGVVGEALVGALLVVGVFVQIITVDGKKQVAFVPQPVILLSKQVFFAVFNFGFSLKSKVVAPELITAAINLSFTLPTILLFGIIIVFTMVFVSSQVTNEQSHGVGLFPLQVVHFVFGFVFLFPPVAVKSAFHASSEEILVVGGTVTE